jgi:hypothetical protein
MKNFAVQVVLAVGLGGILYAAMSAPDAATIERMTGLKAAVNEKEGVVKVSFPRNDLNVVAAGVHITPPMGLTAWAAFQRAGDHTMVMGDIVMTEDQVNTAMSAALDNGLEVTALHNHFFWDTPKIMFMHVGGMGDETKLAEAVGKVFAVLKQAPGASNGVHPQVSIDPANTSLDPQKITQVLGQTGELTKGVYKITFGRTTSMHDHKVGNAMGVNTWAAFAGSDAQAVVDGDFVMKESELQNVLKALRHADIEIVAIHNHMTMENPRMMFLHYWGIGPTVQLAQGLKTALDTQK